MTAGRPKTPLELMQLSAKGDGRTPGGRKIRDQIKGELVPTRRTGAGDLDKRTLPKTPAHLKTRGRAEWFKIWDTGQQWLRPDADYRWVEMIAQNYDMIDQFRVSIEQEGLYTKGSTGQPTANPLINSIKQCESTIQTCLIQLGFGPAARAKLGLAEVKVRTGIAALQQANDDHHKGKKVDTDQVS